MFSKKMEGTLSNETGSKTLPVLVDMETGIFNIPDKDDCEYKVLTLEGMVSVGVFRVRNIITYYGMDGVDQFELFNKWKDENTLHPIYISDLISQLLKFFKLSK